MDKEAIIKILVNDLAALDLLAISGLAGAMGRRNANIVIAVSNDLAKIVDALAEADTPAGQEQVKEQIDDPA